MDLSEEIGNYLLSRGADLVGYADLGQIHPNIRRNLPYGISFAVSLNPDIISAITVGPTRPYFEEYKRVNALLDTLAHYAVEFLKRNNHEATALSATYGHNPATLATPLPHKTVATLAGLGWIGKCALLVTRRFGSAVRLNTVLTDAEITPAEPVIESLCGECIACVEICPARAPSGKNWDPDLPRDEFYNAFACRRTTLALSMKNIGVRESICGLCITACPWTKKYLAKD
jgi:epoxyqueuosine reductase